LWLALLLGFITHSIAGVTEVSFLSGGLGYQLAVIADSLLGWGTFLFLVLSLFIFIIYFFNVTTINAFPVKNPKPMGNDALLPEEDLANTYTDDRDHWPSQAESEPEAVVTPVPIVAETQPASNEIKLDLAANTPIKKDVKKSDPLFTVETPKEESEVLADQLVEAQGAYDPTLDLSAYQFPPLELLNDYDTGKVQVTPEELNQNKDKIIETLVNFKIGIQSIKATIGPTVTLYEIVPDAGIKISRIKNLEDDIALSLAALGIRIIAPIPGKGTIGIEVPNKNREMVTIRSVLSTDRFQKTDKELPVALGKTISNEVLVIDLAKMPHLLVAGATGQGKSVGLNVILTSLLYKRHPSQLKFVLVDPKKVEMSLYSQIERHYLAKLPNSEEAIITDTKKVVYTLQSLCIEMENRYEMLKDAGAKNLKEYNAKFVGRRLNPKEGHRYLPYIVLVIDELADLMMTAGKEVETPIARLAQLARAIGIHLVVATQRPSVNVITGVIKANFPARLSFRVTSKVDSRTILDAGGADQLIGMGDMLLSSGSDIIRLQCPFVDTPEIDRVVEFISAQRGYDSAYLLPEFEGDDESGAATVDLSERDALFEEAARLIVMHQQGSTSLIQRKLKLGYNRAGRLIDQLEAAGIVGAFEGSKAREVLIKDDFSLEQLLNTLKEKHGQS
jgi:S-DNA-T family DNA segregation ATPase FtsK/SpoIIIE